MPRHPRRDKEEQWANLSEELRIHRHIAATFAELRSEPVKIAWQQDELQAFSLLKNGPRLDAGQIRLIRKLCQAVIRVERNCDP